jgi:hypothetical protein
LGTFQDRWNLIFHVLSLQDVPKGDVNHLKEKSHGIFPHWSFPRNMSGGMPRTFKEHAKVLISSSFSDEKGFGLSCVEDFLLLPYKITRTADQLRKSVLSYLL